MNDIELDIGIDTIVFTVEGKLDNKDIDKLYKAKLIIYYDKDNYEHIVENKHNSSIAKIRTYYTNQNESKTQIKLYGMKQIFNYRAELQEEHIILLSWISNLNYYITLDDIDTSLTHFDNYFKTIIIQSDNVQSQINQHQNNISYISNFGTRHFYIHRQQEELLKEIDTRLNINYKLPNVNKGNYKQLVKRELTNYYINYKTTNIKKDEATHIRFNIKDSSTFFKLKDIIEKLEIVVKQSGIEYIADNEVLMLDTSKDQHKLKNYNKLAKDNDEKKISFNILQKKYKELAQNLNTVPSKIKPSRLELSLKKQKLDIKETTTYSTVMTKIYNKLEMVEIIVFKSIDERRKYQNDLKAYITQKHLNKGTGKRTATIKLKNYNCKVLKMKSEQIIKIIDELEELLF